MGRKYITPAEFRMLPLGVTNKAMNNDELLSTYIEVATANVEAFCERIFMEQEYTEVFVGDGSLTFLCEQYPLTGITSLKEVGASASHEVDTQLIRTTANDRCGRIQLTGSGVLTGFGAGTLYEVKYTAGYTTIPAVVKHATALWVTELLQPDYMGPTDGKPDIAPLSSQQISDLLVPLRRRRI